jgi:hypothetical protein
MDLREIAWEGVEWIQLAEDRDRWRTLDEPAGSGATELVNITWICERYLTGSEDKALAGFVKTVIYDIFVGQSWRWRQYISPKR